MTNKDLVLKISGRDDTKDAFNSVQKNIKETEKSSESLAKKLGSLGTGALNLGKKMSLFATTPIVALGGFAVKSASELTTLEDSYKRLSDNMSIDSEVMLQSMRDVSRGAISNKDLLLAANKAMSLGVVKNTEDIATIMEVARVKGQNMGLSMTQAFNDLVTGLGRGSAMILDNLGITVKVGEVNEAYAKSIGKTVQELTAEEQKMALVNAVIGQGKAELEAMGEVQTTQKEKMEAFTASVQNLKDEIGKELLPIVTNIIEKATVWVQKFTDLDDKTKKIILIVAGLVAVAGPLLMLLGSIGIAIQGLSVAFAFIASPIGLVILAIAGLIAIGVLLWKNWDTIKWAANEFWNALKDFWSSGVDFIKDKVDKMLEFFDKIIDKIKDVIEWIKKYSGYNLVQGIGKTVVGAFGGGKAVGGNVSSGTSYLVGERGPELFTPSSSGYITPNNKMGGGITVIVKGNTLLDRNAGEVVGNQIIKKLKLANVL